MEFAKWNESWLEILRDQENKLRMEALCADDAMKIGMIMYRLAKEKYLKPISIRIITGGQTTFSFLMEGTSTNNEWWMDKKLNASRLSGVSSILTLVEVAMGLRAMEPEYEKENDFALCGGCFPIKNQAGKVIGYAQSSGMPHECDHQLIADALAEYLGVE
ncbi:MAG: heme-binding protein, partial [Clostridia bacterium]|nr:heme-binding protein [Clostridia bacterium]